MEILVCIKQVPDDSVEISLDRSYGKTGTGRGDTCRKCI